MSETVTTTFVCDWLDGEEHSACDRRETFTARSYEPGMWSKPATRAHRAGWGFTNDERSLCPEHSAIFKANGGFR